MRIIIILIILILFSIQLSGSDLKYVDVFTSNDGHYPEYRIPSLITTNKGTLLAFAEGRQTLSDHAQNDIVLKRSTDDGKTWGDLIIVHEDGANVLVNPTSVVLPSDRILLMYQHFPAGYHARAIPSQQVKVLQPGITGFPISRTLITYSDDDGLTWSKAEDVTVGTKRPVKIISTASGPGRGIVLSRGKHKGRIIIPTNESWWEGTNRFFNVYACYRDDGSQTWQYGEPAPNGDKGFGNEVQMVELSDGAILLNSRSAEGKKYRKLALSRDGGHTWSPLKDHHQLPNPQCMGSVLRYSWPEDGQSCILYAGPGLQDARESGTVFLSFDDGKSWPHKRRIYPGGYAYSCLTKIKDNSIGVVFEADGYKRIAFTKMTIEWLKQDEVKEPLFSHPYKSNAFFERDTIVITQIDSQQIRYTKDGSNPEANGQVYNEPLIITASTIFRARAFTDDGRMSFVSVLELLKSKYAAPQYNIPYNDKYPASGSLALIDTKKGSLEFNDGAWQGFEETDLDVIINLGIQQTVQKVSVTFLQDLSNWIFFPEFVSFSVSTDGDQFKKVGEVNFPDSKRKTTPLIHEFSVNFDPGYVRYIRINAKNIGVCPDWHSGAGGKAWLFVDEIEIN